VKKLEITEKDVWRYGLKDTHNGERPTAAGIEACRAWLRAFATPSPRAPHKHNSYWYKHRVEDWLRGKWPRNEICRARAALPYAVAPEGAYVGNGEFIVAALREGFCVVACAEGGMNAYVGFTFPVQMALDDRMFADHRRTP